MRRRTITASAVSSNGRLHRAREFVLLALFLAAAGWSLYSFGQEALMSRQLSQQAAAYRDQNAALGIHNEGYRRDIAAVASGAAAEEEARLNGYARSDEKLFVVKDPPPTQTAVRPTVKIVGGQVDPIVSLKRWLQAHFPS